MTSVMKGIHFCNAVTHTLYFCIYLMQTYAKNSDIYLLQFHSLVVQH